MKWCSPTTLCSFKGVVLCSVKDTCHSSTALLCWHSQSHSSFSRLSLLCTRYAFLLGTWCSHSTRQEKQAPEQKQAKTLGLPKIRAVGLTLINWLPFTFSGSLLLVFQGRLHLRGVLKFFSSLFSLPPPSTPPCPFSHTLCCTPGLCRRKLNCDLVC